MSFESHSQSPKVFANKLAEPLTGYLTGAYIDPVANQFGNHNNILTMKKEDGSEFEVVTVGTLGYLAKNLCMSAGSLEVNDKVNAETIKKDAALLGKLIRISPDGSYLNKAKKEIKKFKIEVDKTKTIDALPESEEIPF
jgi:hypothetical protein